MKEKKMVLCWKCGRKEVLKKDGVAESVKCLETGKIVTDFFNPPDGCPIKAAWAKKDEPKSKRVNVKEVLKDKKKKEEVIVRAGVAIQNREGIPTTEAQMKAAYRKVTGAAPPNTIRCKNGCKDIKITEKTVAVWCGTCMETTDVRESKIVGGKK